MHPRGTPEDAAELIAAALTIVRLTGRDPGAREMTGHLLGCAQVPAS